MNIILNSTDVVLFANTTKKEMDIMKKEILNESNNGEAANIII